MNIDQLNKEVTADINSLPVGDMGEVILDEEFFVNIPEIDKFLEPPPDIMESVPENPDDDWLAYIRHTHPFLLGMYIPMRSPGQVILFGQNLRWFYWSLIRSVRSRVQHITQLDMNAAWTVVRMKTHEHELFHYDINVLREMFGGSFTPAIEEALAVAWARLKIQKERTQWNSQIGRMNGQFYNLLMLMAFNYRSAGYRDWILYADDVRFKPAFLSYVAPRNYAKLQAAGVDMEQVLYGMIGQMDKGYIEKVYCR